jgi:hypothetical protein
VFRLSAGIEVDEDDLAHARAASSRTALLSGPGVDQAAKEAR